MTKRFFTWAAIGALFMISGCGGGSTSIDTPEPEIFFVNVSPDAGAVQLRLDDETKFSNVGFLGTSTSFIEVDFKGADVDGYDVSIHEQGGANLELARIAQVFENDTDTVVLVHGLKNFGNEDLKRLRLQNFTVNRTEVNGNRARLIIVHAMERKVGFGTPGIVFKSPGDNAQFQTGTINPGENTVLDVDSGTLPFEVRRAGTEFVYTTSNLTFQPGGVYLVVVTGVEDDPDPAKQIKFTAISLPTVL